jgi:putative peptide zinc metalloprotease protein
VALCPSCRRQFGRDSAVCGFCGSARPGVAAPLELVLPDRTRIPLGEEIIIGRAPGSTIQLEDPTVSRSHARILSDRNGTPWVEDLGSSLGTVVDGTHIEQPLALKDGSRLQIGAQSLSVERHRDEAEAGRTIVVQPGMSLMVSAVGAAGGTSAAATQFGMRPRVRSGYALKRLEESEGSKRFVLRDLNTGKFLRLSDRDAEIFKLLDGQHSLVDIISHAEQAFGGVGAVRVARLLSDLGERGFLAGIASGQAQAEEQPKGFLRRMIGPREKSWTGMGKFFEKLYERGGWIFFTRPLLVLIGLIAVAGVSTFGYLIAARYGTPFVVSKKVGLGALVFLIGRFLVVAVHETAHGLTMASFGRKIDKAGLKFMFVLPYAFVDTNEAWFENRRRRIGISAAGPVSDFALGGIFSLCALLLEGTVREVFFQLAFAGYIGAFFNLNPFLDRDGYQMLVDVLKEPGLKKRAKDQFERRLSGRGKAAADSPVLMRYSLFGLLWGVMGAGFAIFMTQRYAPIMKNLAPDLMVDVILYSLAVVVFLPVLFVIGKPLLSRLRGGPDPEPEPI